MRKILKHGSMWMLALTAALLIGCQQSDDVIEEKVDAGHRDSYVYPMQFHVSLGDYGLTRATGYQWKAGDQVLLKFPTTTGTATRQADGQWQIETKEALAETFDGLCQTALIVDASRTTTTQVVLTQQSRIYTDTQAAWIFTDGVLTVSSVLTPLVGRVRFRGEAGTPFTVSGLSFYQRFTLADHTLTSAKATATGTIGSDGFSPYYYAFFATDEHRLVFEQSATTGLLCDFGADVLQRGQSGYIVVPTMQSHEGWTLVCLSNMQEITVPTVSATTVSGVSFQSATFAATVSALNNGTLQDAGFVYSTHAAPTLSDTKLSLGKSSTTLQQRVSTLEPETTYYVRAYATNEAGIAYGAEATFTTKQKPSDPSFDIDDYGDDQQWD